MSIDVDIQVSFVKISKMDIQMHNIYFVTRSHMNLVGVGEGRAQV